MSKSSEAARDAAQTVAAVDLGSNSFHMVVARATGNELHVVDRLKESVRLAAGLDDKRRLDEDARKRALDCLERFGQRLRPIPVGWVRAVGTQTLRRAKGIGGFLAEAETALGHPIEIIYGAEEARLIYGGVAQDLSSESPRRLVADIGGSSTELIVGELAEPLLIESVSLGAVTHSQRYFPNGKIDKKSWKAAVLGARVALESLQREYRAQGWDKAVGASGSIKAVQKVCTEAGWTQQNITSDALNQLGKALIKAGHIDKLKLSGLADDRRAIFAGGTAVLTGIFESLELDEMEVSDKALREGLLLDLLGRLDNKDTREASIVAAGLRYGVDRAHAERVAHTAQQLLAQNPHIPGAKTVNTQRLRWAAMLHEIGLAISHKGYHRHGEYIVRNADLQGFSQSEQVVLATLIRLHRGKLRDEVLAEVPDDQQLTTRWLALVLRIAVLVHRGRDPEGRPDPTLQLAGEKVSVAFANDWLDSHPLTREDLEREREQLARVGYKLKISG